MQGWSLGVGRWFGVDVQLHPFLLLVLACAMGWSASLNEPSGRGLLLWLLLLGTLLLNATAQILGAAWFGLELRALLLLPTGAVAGYVGGDRPEIRHTLRRLALIGPAANLLFCLVLAGLIRSISPAVDLLARPWITPGHLLRSWGWLNLLFAVVQSVPVALGRSTSSLARSGAGPRLPGYAGGVLPSLAIGFILAGLLLGSGVWLVVLGAVLLVVLQLGSIGAMPEGEVDAVRIRDIMLLQFATISASDTIEDALERSLHTMQDVFPVVRGGSLVGAVSRRLLVQALAEGGNSYVQGVMTRNLQTAQPDDRVGSTMHRLIAGQGVQLVPVLDGERVVGIITLQDLSRSMRLLNQYRRLRRATADPGE